MLLIGGRWEHGLWTPVQSECLSHSLDISGTSLIWSRICEDLVTIINKLETQHSGNNRFGSCVSWQFELATTEPFACVYVCVYVCVRVYTCWVIFALLLSLRAWAHSPLQFQQRHDCIFNRLQIESQRYHSSSFQWTEGEPPQLYCMKCKRNQQLGTDSP